jgi:hypothetical protein
MHFIKQRRQLLDLINDYNPIRFGEPLANKLGGRTDFPESVGLEKIIIDSLREMGSQ